MCLCVPVACFMSHSCALRCSNSGPARSSRHASEHPRRATEFQRPATQVTPVTRVTTRVVRSPLYPQANRPVAVRTASRCRAVRPSRRSCRRACPGNSPCVRTRGRAGMPITSRPQIWARSIRRRGPEPSSRPFVGAPAVAHRRRSGNHTIRRARSSREAVPTSADHYGDFVP